MESSPFVREFQLYSYTGDNLPFLFPFVFKISRVVVETRIEAFRDPLSIIEILI